MSEHDEKFKAVTEDLNDPNNYKKFVADPREYLGGHGVEIDQALSDLLKDKLQGTNSLDDAKAGGETYAFAIAIGPEAVAPGPAIAVAII